MTTIRQLITDAYREGGLIGKGEFPDADQLDEGLRKLQSLYRSFFGAELGQPLMTLNAGSSGDLNSFGKFANVLTRLQETYIPENSRIVFNLSAPTTLYFPPVPQDGSRISVIDSGASFSTTPLTLEGNGRSIEGSSSISLDTDGDRIEWFYRADLGSWERVEGFTANSQSPLPFEFDELLSTLLALRLTSRFGAQITPEINSYMQRMVSLFRARYSQITQVPSELALTRLPSDRYVNNRYYNINSTDQFNYGDIGWWR